MVRGYNLAPMVGFEPTVLARQINSLLSLPVPLHWNYLVGGAGLAPALPKL